MGCTFSTPCPQPINPSCDGIRDTPLRLFGYGAHVGNACSAILPCHLANLPAMVTTAYVTADIFNKGLQTSADGKSRQMIFVNVLDAVIWQSLATIILPGLIIGKIKDITVKATKPPANACAPTPPLLKIIPPSLVKAVPCIIGVLTLPLIMYPIDQAVTLLMDYTYRPIFKENEPCENSKKNSKPKTPPPPSPPPKPVKKEPTKTQKEAA